MQCMRSWVGVATKLQQLLDTTDLKPDFVNTAVDACSTYQATLVEAMAFETSKKLNTNPIKLRNAAKALQKDVENPEVRALVLPVVLEWVAKVALKRKP